MQQTRSNLLNTHLLANVREIRPHCRSLAVNHMAGGALALAEEVPFAGRAVAGNAVFSSGRVHRVDQRRKRVQFAGWEVVERRHTSCWNSVVNYAAQPRN